MLYLVNMTATRRIAIFYTILTMTKWFLFSETPHFLLCHFLLSLYLMLSFLLLLPNSFFFIYFYHHLPISIRPFQFLSSFKLNPFDKIISCLGKNFFFSFQKKSLYQNIAEFRFSSSQRQANQVKKTRLFFNYLIWREFNSTHGLFCQLKMFLVNIKLFTGSFTQNLHQDFSAVRVGPRLQD